MADEAIVFAQLAKKSQLVQELDKEKNYFFDNYYRLHLQMMQASGKEDFLEAHRLKLKIMHLSASFEQTVSECQEARIKQFSESNEQKFELDTPFPNFSLFASDHAAI